MVQLLAVLTFLWFFSSRVIGLYFEVNFDLLLSKSCQFNIYEHFSVLSDTVQLLELKRCR